MKNYCELAAKYQIKAPLVQLAPELNLRDYIRTCGMLSITAKVTELIGEIAAVCMDNSEQLTSIESIAETFDKKSPSTIRAHLKTLVAAGLCHSEFITTDPIKGRRGTLFTLAMPEKKQLSEQLSNPAPLPSSTSETEVVQTAIESQTKVTDERDSVATSIVTRFLVKAMRTNRKDKRTSFNVNIATPNGDRFDIESEAEGGRLMAVPDLAYYSGALSWLLAHLEVLHQNEQEPTTETYNIPLHQLIILSKKASTEDATSRGYGNAAIEGLRKISSTTFNLGDIPAVERKFIQTEQVFLKLLRLERIANYQDDKGHRRRLVTLQFPAWTIQACWRAILTNGEYTDIMAIEDALLQSKNEIEILFGLWANDIITTGQTIFVRRPLNWNELREMVAPNSGLNEFKRKFTSFLIQHHDESYKPSESSKSRRDKLIALAGNIWVKENGKREYIVEYGKALAHGLIINVGFDEEQGQTLISLRQNIASLQIRFKNDFKENSSASSLSS